MTLLRFLGLGLVAALLFLTLLPVAAGADEVERGRVVLAVIDRMALEDLSAGAFAGLVGEAALGLMNTNTGGQRNVENAHATIGAGSRIVATGAGFAGFEAGERVHKVRAGEEFARRTGVGAPEGSVVHLGVARIWSLSRDLPYSVEVGALGQRLRAAGLRTGVIGNADWEGMDRRAAVTIAMDNRGLVDRGLVGEETLTPDPQFPGGARTDYESLFTAFEALEDVDFLVIDLGDLSRLEEARPYVLPDVLDAQRALALARSAQFLERVWAELEPGRDLLVVVSPTPPAAAIARGSTLSPVLLLGGDGPGTLTSYSTRRAGIVTNMDLAPTVLSFFGIEPPASMTGRTLTVLPGTSDLPGLLDLNRQLVLTHNVRVPIIKGYMSLQIVLVIAVMLTILIRDLQIVRREYLQGLLLVFMGFPLAALLLPLLPQPGPLWVGLEVTLLTLAIGAVALRVSRKSPLGAFALLGGITAVTIVSDLFLGVPLQQYSLLSYDPLGGARYYGIGNEFMGVLVGASIMTGAVAMTAAGRQQRAAVFIATGVFFLVALFAIANPKLGANMGGTITAVVSFLLTLLLFLGVRFTRRLLLASTGGVALFLAGLVAFEFARGVEHQSHIGRAARLVFGGDLATAVQESYNIIQRKVSMNLKLMRYTIWSRVFLASLGGLMVLFYRPTGRMRRFREQYPFLFKGLVGIVTASVIALVFNDSGVVAAATVMVLGAPPLLYFFLKEGV